MPPREEKSSHPPQPPQPPQVARRVNLSRLQQIGLPVLVLIPLLALFGVFGVSELQEQRANEELDVTVHYVNRTRLRSSHSLVVEVRNISGRRLENVAVAVDRKYLEAFGDVGFTPSASGVDDSAYRILLGTIPAAETRVVTADLQPARQGQQDGAVSVFADGVTAVELEFGTFVFP